MRQMLTIASLALSLATPAIACDVHGKTGIAEENNLFIPVGAKTGGGITEEQFNETIDRAVEIYAPIIAEKDANLVVERNWDDGTVNAYANQSGSTWKVAMFGGLARHSAITQDGFALVLCHELGHHLGGAPKIVKIFWPSWASNEGQADYFSTSKCFRKYAEKDDNIALMANKNVDPTITKKCEENFSDAAEVALCQRSAMGGTSLATLLNELRNGSNPIDVNTPDQNVVRKTDDKHPAAQCRFDTYFQGSICSRLKTDDFDDKDPNIGACNRVANDIDGLRPLCWYKPEAEEELVSL